jgi:formylglycine-generating enzyme required for sulfatase activity
LSSGEVGPPSPTGLISRLAAVPARGNIPDVPTKAVVVITCGLVAAAAVAAAAAGATEVTTGQSETLPSTRAGGMVPIPGGLFTMGLAADELPEAELACAAELGYDQTEDVLKLCDRLMNLHAEETGAAHEVYVSPFLIDKYEVTAGAYHTCVAAGTCDLAPLVAGDTRTVRKELPVVNVTWYDARTYCGFVGKRLPTEAEWEKAARGDDRRHFPWGNVDADDRANRGQMQDQTERPIGFPPDHLPSKLSDSDGAAGPAAPGSYRFGRSPYGVEDMAGNVAEWVADWFSQAGYAGLSQIDPTGVGAGTSKVVRGGSYADPRFFSRTYHRRKQLPDDATVNVGFRCARDIP